MCPAPLPACASGALPAFAGLLHAVVGEGEVEASLLVGQGVFVGFLGIGGMNAPFYVYVSRWFDRHRGSALALISSGSYLAGAVWPQTIVEDNNLNQAISAVRRALGDSRDTPSFIVTVAGRGYKIEA